MRSRPWIAAAALGLAAALMTDLHVESAWGAVHICRMFSVGAPEGMDDHMKCINQPEVIDGKDYIRNRCDYTVAVTLEWESEGVVALGAPNTLLPDETVHVSDDPCLLWVEQTTSRPLQRVYLFNDVHLGPKDETELDHHANFLSHNQEMIVVIEGQCCTAVCDENAVDVGIRTVLRGLLSGGVNKSQILLRNAYRARVEESCSDAVRHIELLYPGYTRVK